MEDDTSTSLDWRQVKCNPLVFQGFRPPFTVPPEQVSTWTDKDERDYKFWLGVGSKNTKDDYRQFLLSLNMESDMNELFNKIDVGLEAFEKLVACMREFPNYKLNKDLDQMYPKDSAISKAFIKCGVDFVTKYPYENKNDHEAVSETTVSDTSVGELSQFDFSPDTIPQVDTIKTSAGTVAVSDDCSTEPGGQPETGSNIVDNSKKQITIVHLSQGDIIDTTHRTPKQKKTRRNKERRQERLLKFQQKLVMTSGLTPSRLMVKKSSLDLIKRNLQDEFANLGSNTYSSISCITSCPCSTTTSCPSTSSSTTSSTLGRRICWGYINTRMA